MIAHDVDGEVFPDSVCDPTWHRIDLSNVSQVPGLHFLQTLVIVLTLHLSSKILSNMPYVSIG